MEFFSATTDIWSRSNRSFIAVSVHYFVGDELQTQFIACDEFPGRHTHDKVAAKLNVILNKFGILNKVFFVTSDNAGEYCAAFKRFGDNYESISFISSRKFNWVTIDDQSGDEDEAEGQGDSDDEEDFNANTAEDDDDSCDSDSEYEIDFPGYMRNDENDDLEIDHNGDVFRVASMFPDEEEEISEESRLLLPNSNRISCSSHMLEKLARIDSKKAETDDEVYGAAHKRVFDKLQQIWDLKASRLSSEIFHGITGKKLIGPHRIRWLKTFDAVIIRVFFLNYCIMDSTFN